jgi:Icc-related predicted phosphoesterase
LTGDLGNASLARKMAFENVDRMKHGLPKKRFSHAEEKAAFMEIYDSAMDVVKYLSGFAPVLTVYGNVEGPGKKGFPSLYNDLHSLKNVRVINNKLTIWGNVRIGGLKYFIDTDWARDFRPGDAKLLKKAKKETEKAKKTLNNFHELDILLCHQPPFGFMDKVTAKFAPKHWQGKHAGSKLILDYIKKEQPDYVFCGHIHEGEGSKKIGNTQVYNLGICSYKLVEY